MDYDVVAAAAAAVPHPRAIVPPPSAAVVPAADAPPPAGAQPLTAAAVRPAPPARRVELSFHEDLRVLITRLIDEGSGETVSQMPADQVLDLVTAVMKRIRHSEEH